MAPDVHSMRGKAFSALLKILLTAQHMCEFYHPRTTTMEGIREAINAVHIVDRENFDGDYDGYYGLTRSGPVDKETARTSVGVRGDCKIRKWCGTDVYMQDSYMTQKNVTRKDPE